jgi:hypothetical protein
MPYNSLRTINSINVIVALPYHEPFHETLEQRWQREYGRYGKCSTIIEVFKQ